MSANAARLCRQSSSTRRPLGEFGINAVFVENYWNDGSPADQERYFDNFVVSVQRIGCGGAPSS